MKAMIFAAGLGTRLKPFTDIHPKALAPVGGVPMLGRVIGRIKEAGITDITVNVHHFADQITDYLRLNNNFDIDIHISDERALLLDTGGGVAHAAPLLNGDEPILLHNADIFSNFPLREMIDAHTRNGADVTLLVARRNSSRMLYFDVSNLLAGWQNLNDGTTRPDGFNPDQPGLLPLAFGGVHIISPSLLAPLQAAVSEGGPVFSIIPFYLQHISEFNIAGFQPDGEFVWFDIGKPESLAAANRFVNESPNAKNRYTSN